MSRSWGIGDPATVYAIHVPHLRVFKIGVSRNVPKRARQLASKYRATRVVIVAQIPGSMAEESRIHRLLGAWSVTCRDGQFLGGECFRDCERTRAWLDALLPDHRCEVVVERHSRSRRTAEVPS